MRNKLNSTSTWLATILVTVSMSLSPAFSSPLFPPEKERRVKEAVLYVLNGEEKKGEPYLRQLATEDPESPEGWFFVAGMYAEVISLYHDWSLMDKFEEYAETVVKKAEARLSKDPNDYRALFYLGNIHGYYALLHGQQGNFFQAFKSAVKTVNSLSRSLELEPTLSDSYYGLGTVNYYSWKLESEKGGLVGWVVRTFITGGKDYHERGVEMLRLAMEGRGITEGFAGGILMWIELSRGNLAEAEALASALHADAPNDTQPIWVLGRVAALRNDCASAKDHFGELLSFLRDRKLPPERFPEVVTAWEISSVCKDINDQEPKHVVQHVKELRRRVRADNLVWLEYSNAEGVQRDWLTLLDRMEACAKERALNEALVCTVGQGPITPTIQKLR